MQGGTSGDGDTSKGAAEIRCSSAGCKCCACTECLHSTPSADVGAGVGDDSATIIKTPRAITGENKYHLVTPTARQLWGVSSGFGTRGSSHPGSAAKTIQQSDLAGLMLATQRSTDALTMSEAGLLP